MDSTPAMNELNGGLPSLRGKFLLASASLEEPNFTRTVILVVRHDEEGALGLVVNRPLGVSLAEACAEEVEAAKGVEVPLFLGGPCSGPLVAVHNLEPLAQAEAELSAVEAFNALQDDESEADESAAAKPLKPLIEAVMPGVWFCERREALEALMRHVRRAEEEGGEAWEQTAVKFVAGYSGWGAGQLELELAEGAWQLIDADVADVYAGGSNRHPVPPPRTPLPMKAMSLLSLLAAHADGPDPLPALASGVRQWVRLTTHANLSRVVDPKRIPSDPSVN